MRKMALACVVAAVALVTAGVGQAYAASHPDAKAKVRNGLLTYDAVSYFNGDDGVPDVVVTAPHTSVPSHSWADEDLPYETHPKFSPDGTEVAYSDPTDTGFTITIRDVASGDVIDTLPFPTAVSLDWSPDGTQMVLVDSAKMYILDIATRDVATIWDRKGTIQSPAWSPDGAQIAFGRGCAIRLIKPTGGAASVFAPTPATGCNSAPDWSPDGSQIAFLTSQFGFGELVSLPRDGQGPLNRISVTAGQPADTYGFYSVAWSPNGQKIAVLLTNFLPPATEWTRIRWFAADGSDEGWLTPNIDPDGQTGTIDWGPKLS
jgi:WD40 repeat protein